MVQTVKQKQREQLATDVQKFIEQGGEIMQAQLEDCKFYKDSLKSGKKQTQGAMHRERNRISWNKKVGVYG